jgi:hypothetical protein
MIVPGFASAFLVGVGGCVVPRNDFEHGSTYIMSSRWHAHVKTQSVRTSGKIFCLKVVSEHKNICIA